MGAKDQKTEALGRDVEPGGDTLVELSQYEPYVKPGFLGMFESKYVVVCSFVVRLGGFLFGYDQGVVSIILTTDQFITVFPRISDESASGAFWKGFLTALLQLGAVLGAFNQGWIAEKISRKRSIALAACIFIVGSIMQTAAHDYSLLVVGRFIGGIGVGMLSMVVPMW
ncbi:hypothetical protein LTR37_010880 [Vermiconidia calcicola]|uniref:Uncharacterized protein n=1 Tax=Vermiconidia calcicola TaxID=1690605 RepID=A0ACC3N3R4_9PEZI|nr:hypothetical protein LTR37_010880 [Vermiconidia calcicola]